MIQTISIATEIDRILLERGYTHKIIIESDFSVIVHYVQNDDDDYAFQNENKESLRKDIFARYNQGKLSLDDYYAELKKIEGSTTKRESYYNIEDYIFKQLHIKHDTYAIEFRAYTQAEYENAESFVASIFQGNTIASMSRYRLNGHFDNNPQKIEGDVPPVVTFYSYKGGMARTTTMISYAIERASQGKRVFIIDCDLEAPGYLNFFDLSEHSQLKSGEINGLVEMVSDIEFLQEYDSSEFDYQNYYLNIVYGNEKYSKYNHILENIFLMPAGNLNENEDSLSSINVNHDYYNDVNETEVSISSVNRQHYLEGLSRINLSNPQVIKDIFTDLFKYLKNVLHIDLILIDSRTGFSDIIFNSIKYFSKHIVAFFGSNNQSIPGLLNLLDEYYNKNNNFGLTLVNSILPQNEDSNFWESRFNDVFIEYRNKLQDNEEKNECCVLPLHRNTDFEKIGIKCEQYDDTSYIETIISKANDDYNNIFDEINDNLFHEEVKQKNIIKDNSVEEINDATAANVSNKFDYLYSASALKLKQNILHELKTTLKKIKSFAEDCDMDERLFYYRDCMNDLFEQDKFLIKGYKGTGKTYLYLALEQPNIRKNLLLRANNKRIRNGLSSLPDSDYISVQVLDTNTVSERKKFFEFGEFISPQSLQNYNFTRFWRLHTWNSLLLENEFQEIRKASRYNNYIQDIVGYSAIELYKKCLSNDNLDLFAAIDEDMTKINNYLKNNNKKMFILYDQLDSRINPLYWNDIVSPLINYWKDYYPTYSNILPKIFVRTDLMHRIQGTNTARLKENIIEIEWSINEIFAYFIKLTMSNDYARKCLEIILTRRIFKYNKSTMFPSDDKLIDNQYQLDNILDASLSPYVYAFFGKKVIDSAGRSWGNPYQYFQNNLCNADKKSTSLRPFINTMDNNAIEDALTDNKKYVTAIIPSTSYTSGKVKEKAANTYFEDLTQDKYSKDLIYFKEFLDLKDGDPYRYKSLNQQLYEDLLKTVFEKYEKQFIVVKNIKDLDSILEANGIIVEKFSREGKYYQFAPLYYYIWSLKSTQFDEKEDSDTKRIGRYTRTLLLDGTYRYYVLNNKHKFVVKYCDDIFKVNQMVSFVLKSEKSYDSDKPFYYATDLKPVEE